MLFTQTTKIMKKVIYALILALVVVGGLLFANLETNNESSKKPSQKTISIAEMKAEKKKWEASPDGVNFKKWEKSPEGSKVHADASKIMKHISAFNDMEAVITSLSLPPGSRLAFGMMVKIDDIGYIVNFQPEKSQLEQLYGLKVNDKIIIRSHNISYAPKYSYPIISGDYIERDGKVIYKREPRNDGC